MAMFIKAMVGGRLLDEQMQRIRMDSIQPITPATPDAGYGLGIIEFPGKIYGHDGQMPGFMTFMGYDPVADNTIIIATNLATVPSGQGSALVLVKAILPVLYGSGAIPGGPGAGPPATAASGSTASTTPRLPANTGECRRPRHGRRVRSCN